MENCAPHRIAAPRPGLWGRALRALFVARQRRALATLEDHLLRDIGLDREQALAEARLSIWDAPGHWHG